MRLQSCLLATVVFTSTFLFGAPPGYKAVPTADPDDLPPSYGEVAGVQPFGKCGDPRIQEYMRLAGAIREELLRLQGQYRAAPSQPGLAAYFKDNKMREFVSRKGAAYGALARFHPLLLQRLRLLAECQRYAQEQGTPPACDGLTSCGHGVSADRDAAALRSLHCPRCSHKVSHTYSIRDLLADPGLTEWLRSITPEKF
ncbi:MAG: hypothetical protein HYW48_07385 [Deltaproteobacteria bacterium]|nr:hypothetical protein [Deltaproteobacteria bacterium]